ncbi:MAG: hypothetical protein AB7S71_22825 [Dongiaceae bacterium]
MRIPMLFACAAILLAACASEPRRTDASLPTVSYRFDSEAELREAALRADDYCGENYGLDARLAEPVDGSGEATFVCVED